MANRCKPTAVKVNAGIWYYENPGSIDLVINRKWFEGAATHQGIIVKISRRKLQSSLSRMNASRRKRK